MLMHCRVCSFFGGDFYYIYLFHEAPGEQSSLRDVRSVSQRHSWAAANRVQEGRRARGETEVFCRSAFIDKSSTKV